jgi:UDP-N-acetyl-D-galactosamine dehydrogenase
MNDGMGKHVAAEVVKLMVQRDIKIKGSKVLVLGITFKENCPDVRNTKAVDVVSNLKSYGINVDVFDPWASPEEVMHEYGLKTTKKPEGNDYDGLVLAVAHKEFANYPFNSLLKDNGVLYDVKGYLEKSLVNGRL